MRIQRRWQTFVHSAAIFVGLGLSTFMITQMAPRPAWGLNAKSVNLQETLEKGLKARRPEEFAFIQRVILLVDNGTLPLDLVRSTFDWARTKRPVPFVYFERGLKVRAARIGVAVN